MSVFNRVQPFQPSLPTCLYTFFIDRLGKDILYSVLIPFLSIPSQYIILYESLTPMVEEPSMFVEHELVECYSDFIEGDLSLERILWFRQFISNDLFKELNLCTYREAIRYASNNQQQECIFLLEKITSLWGPLEIKIHSFTRFIDVFTEISVLFHDIGATLDILCIKAFIRSMKSLGNSAFYFLSYISDGYMEASDVSDETETFYRQDHDEFPYWVHFGSFLYRCETMDITWNFFWHFLTMEEAKGIDIIRYLYLLSDGYINHSDEDEDTPDPYDEYEPLDMYSSHDWI